MSEAIDWDLVVEDLGPRIFSYFKRRGYQAHASDLTQEVLVRLVEKVETGSFDTEKGSLTQFAFGIAHYIKLENKQRAQTEELSDEIVADNFSAEDILSQKQRFALVRSAIAELSEIQQSVMNLVLEEQLRLEEIAEILKLPVGTVKSHVARSKEKIKQNLQDKWEWL